MIDTEELEAVFKDCLFRSEEVTEGSVPDDAVIVTGILRKFGFHPGRLLSHKEQVTGWLNQLPHQFREKEGGGWSFLNACLLEDGITQWGEHRGVDQLFCLGMALNLVKCQLPRELWPALPGGLPYYVIMDTGEEAVR